jgi:hypothetical protein
MRFPSKKSLVRASLCLILAVPTLAEAAPSPDAVSTNATEKTDDNAKTADTQVDATKKDPVANWQDLKFDQAKTAFGPEFSVNNIGGTYTLFGGTSADCLPHFDIHNDGATGEFWIRYDGLNKDCLSFDTVKAKTAPKDFVLLSEQPDSKMTPTGTFAAVQFRSANPYSGLHPFDRDPLASSEKDKDGKAIVLSNTSEADKKKQREQDEIDKRNAQISVAEKVISTCKHGISELDIVPSWISFLANQPQFMKDKDADWESETLKKNRDREFAACSRQIRRGTIERDKMDEKTVAALSTCDVFLKTLASEDPDSVAKIKKMYMSLLNRYLQSAPPGLESEYDAAMELLAKVREFDLSDDESSDLANLEQNLNIHFLNAAAAEGTDSKEFQAMKANMLTYMFDRDKAGCLSNQGLLMPYALRAGKNCASAAYFSSVFNQQLSIANTAQFGLNQKAAFEKLKADVAVCSAMRTSAAQAGVAMDPAQDAHCKPLEAQVAALSKPLVNNGLGSTSFGQVSTGAPNAAATGATNAPAVTAQQTVSVPVKTAVSNAVTPGSGVRRLTR